MTYTTTAGALCVLVRSVIGYVDSGGNIMSVGVQTIFQRSTTGTAWTSASKTHVAYGQTGFFGTAGGSAFFDLNNGGFTSTAVGLSVNAPAGALGYPVKYSFTYELWEVPN